jgi:hypothetical protein
MVLMNGYPDIIAGQILFKLPFADIIRLYDTDPEYQLFYKENGGQELKRRLKKAYLFVDIDRFGDTEVLDKIRYSENHLKKKHATVHLVKLGKDLDRDRDDMITLDDLEEMYPQVKSVVRRGDIIENVDRSGYRSDGVYMIDIINGRKCIVNQNYDYDDYGSPNVQFIGLQEFPLDYWNPMSIYVNSLEPDTDSEFYWHGVNPFINCVDETIYFRDIDNIYDVIHNTLIKNMIKYDDHDLPDPENKHIYMTYVNNMFPVFMILDDPSAKNEVMYLKLSEDDAIVNHLVAKFHIPRGYIGYSRMF